MALPTGWDSIGISAPLRKPRPSSGARRTRTTKPGDADPRVGSGTKYCSIECGVTGAVAATVVVGAAVVVYHRRVAASARFGGPGLRPGHGRHRPHGRCLYEAAVFPFVAGSVNEEEQQACRTLAYRFATYDALPRQVRVAAAEALESIDDGQDKKTAQTTVRALTMSVYGHRLDNR
ncbi:hypothetical protein [Streptomyces sp. NBC_00046]|uniref:hypothetical protein n=1 Tax=Streptomyces sp. NBC_00046 TaxID=2975626 RepID=UPI003255BE38